MDQAQLPMNTGVSNFFFKLNVLLYQCHQCCHMRTAVVIGAGIAGIASALRLRKRGFHVKVVEANTYPGGKLHAFSNDGFRFDFGPSLFTMPELVDELFSLFGEDPTDYFQYRKKNVLCNYFWDDGTRFAAHADRSEFVERAVDVFDVDAPSVEAYLQRSEEKYKMTTDIFLRKSLHRWSTYTSLGTLKSLLRAGKLHLNDTLDEVNRSYFDDPRLVQLFNRYATYNGSSPYRTPGIMSMIPHLEMGLGTFFPEGGMHSISMSLYRLACDVGVEFHFGERVESIETNGHLVSGVRTSNEVYQADLVFTNVDVYNTFHHLMPKAKRPKKVLAQERSSSAVVFYWGIDRTFEQLDLHNIFFSRDYEKEFEELFVNKTIHNDPTIYVNITCKDNPSDAPSGCENWFVMVNAPTNEHQDWAGLTATLRQNIIDKLSRNLGVDIASCILTEKVLDPVSIERITGSHQGSLYGTSSNSKFAAFLRQPNFSKQFKNLYFCGGSVHPGGGIPLCLLSAKIATDLVNG